MTRRGVEAGEQGTTLIEVMIASAILCTLMAGLMSMSILAVSTTENQGHLAARATEYAQDKMEQLLALQYGDVTSDTRTFPAPNTGGTGLLAGGSYNVDSPVALYVDYLDLNGNLCGSASALAATPPCAAPVGTTPPTNWFYGRAWKIEDTTTTLKKITVATATARGFGGTTRATSYLAILKTSPF
jgi:hypothetical protein